MFQRNTILVNKNTGAQFRVLATPDISALVVEPGVRVPCYGLQDWSIPSDHLAKVSYVAQDVVEGGELVAL